MLGKLFKHEFKSTSKMMLIIYAIMTVVTLLGMAFFRLCDITNTGTSEPMLILSMIYLVIYIISLLAFTVISYVYVTLHFYKSMYSAWGYLTHTLPVKPLTTFHVKAMVSSIWLLLANTLTFLSIMGFIYSLFDPMVWRDIMPAFFDLESLLVSIYGLSVGELSVVMILSLLLSPILMVMMIALACSIGQLFSRQKVAASVVAGIILYLINQIIGNVLSMSFMINIDLDSTTALPDTYGSILWSSLGISALYALICYIGCNIIIRKHINLE